MKTIDIKRHGNVTSSDNPPGLIDTSRMSPGQRAALELTEAARDAQPLRSTFASGLFMGDVRTGEVFPFPAQTPEARDQGDAFLVRLGHFLREHVDPEEIDRTGEIPEEVIRGLQRLGAFGIKVSPRYGGLGLSQTNYCRAAEMLGSHCGNLTALLSAHQSIGVPQPLILFGTDDQKRRFLPRVAGGEISAFALTEAGVGSDPARMKTHAEPVGDGSEFLLNGEKLWCTNGTKAGIVVVMARTPATTRNGEPGSAITAFIVEMSSPGVEVVRRCHFMGLRALYNGVIHFHNVRVPRENILLGEGKGMKVALSTLNTGRLTLPAACLGLSKRCLKIAREWSCQREQWGSAIGRHSAIADKLARMAADVFALEAMTMVTASKVDRDKHADVRIEAAMCKLWGSERAWNIVNETMQIRGGRGYETADSLRDRGEPPIGVERMLRDSRINTIFEGSSEIMRLFIAREALDPHLRAGGAVLNTRLSLARRAMAAVKAGFFYAAWYPRQWLPVTTASVKLHPRLRPQLRFVRRTSRRLARALFHAMIRFGPGLEKRQMLLGRFVDIGTELFAMSASLSRAQLLWEHDQHTEPLSLADTFCRNTRLRLHTLFREVRDNNDPANYHLAQEVLNGEYQWLEAGIL
ncbi:MAG TPA: acyl-CoA dehydrogenase family protein [Roseimicrobium sp.]|nr:acyl-CoA dehydrogenase family protein [Roseimicrobium sp.]